MVGALWKKDSVFLDRTNAPSAVCERNEKTGASGNYMIRAYYRNGELDSPNDSDDAALTCDEINSKGETVRTVEGHYRHSQDN